MFLEYKKNMAEESATSKVNKKNIFSKFKKLKCLHDPSILFLAGKFEQRRAG